MSNYLTLISAYFIHYFTNMFLNIFGSNLGGCIEPEMAAWEARTLSLLNAVPGKVVSHAQVLDLKY